MSSQADEVELASDQFQIRTLSQVETLRHSTAHLMASAIDQLFPGTKFAIGPHIEHGFYYDMELAAPLVEEDLPRIEAKMHEIAKGNHKFEHFVMSREEAKKWAAEAKQPYKSELIDGFTTSEVSFYKHGDFTDMCAGPHVNYTSKLKHFKLTHIAGAYWRGDEKNAMLTRVYGLAFETKDELEAHVKLMEEAARRDHRRLGKELDLFLISQEYGGGLVLWLPNGAFIRKQIEDFWREQHLLRGYEILFTPHVAPLALWDRSGHTGFYKDSMFAPMDVEGQMHQLKPMNCPFHIGVFKNRQKSYRDLPARYAELGTVYRYERSGALHGLMRVRGFTQDDAHIFCTTEQLESEINGCIDFAQVMYATFGFPEYKVELSVRDPKNKGKYLGEDADWELAEAALANVLKGRGVAFKRMEGEAAFYGPKIDVKVVDAIGRVWQLTTVQVDFNLPQRFDLHYIGADNQHHRPFMVHRALLGSIERFFGILIEHYGGDFPLWLAPVQAKILPISEKFQEYAKQVEERLRAHGFRAKIDTSDEKLGYKIRKAELEKVPYALVLGQKEAEAQTVGVRKRHQGDLGAMSVDQLCQCLEDDLVSRGGPPIERRR